MVGLNTRLILLEMFVFFPVQLELLVATYLLDETDTLVSLRFRVVCDKACL